MFTKCIARSLMVLACFFALTACDDKSAEKAQQEQAQKAPEQSEVEKYNEYVRAANMATVSFAQDLEQYQKNIQPVFDGKKRNKNLFYSNPIGISRVQEQLDKARAMKPAMAELDESARVYSEALAKADPLSRDVYNYISAKTYLSDEGAHGREIQPAYLDAMQKLVVAQADFLNGIDAKDRARIKAEFESSEKGSIDHYRIGMVYYLKESMDAADGVYDGTGLGDKKEAFRNALNQFNSMVTAYDGKVRERNKTGCSSLKMTANSYLSTGREIIESTEEGTYEKEAKKPKQFRLMEPQQKRDASSLLQHYNNMINELNVNRC